MSKRVYGALKKAAELVEAGRPFVLVTPQEMAHTADVFATLDQYDQLPEPTQIKEMRGELTTPEKVVEFVKGGNATFTLQSHKTEARFTYKVRKPDNNLGPASFFVSLLNGPDNENNFTYIGIIRNDQAGERFTLTKNSRITSATASYKAFEYFWRAIVTQKRPQNTWGLSVWHEGRCGRCGRKLTVPNSVSIGFGPECATRMGL